MDYNNRELTSVQIVKALLLVFAIMLFLAAEWSAEEGDVQTATVAGVIAVGLVVEYRRLDEPGADPPSVSVELKAEAFLVDLRSRALDYIDHELERRLPPGSGPPGSPP